MKVRLDFVTNSSSSSFVIPKSVLTELQIQQIKDYASVAECLGIKFYDGWNITETEEEINGNTYMDNGDMKKLLKKIGVPKEYIEGVDD